MSSRQECFRKEHMALSSLMDDVRLVSAELSEAASILELLAQQDVADTSVEGEALAKMTDARRDMERLITRLSALIGNVWEARSPNPGLFEQETETWQRTHPATEWYKKDIEKL